MKPPRKPVPALAIAGGPPVRATPVAPWPYFAPDEIEAAAEVLRSGKVNYWTGDQNRLFEAEFAAAIGARHAIALANGTVALELALHALGIGPGDEVVTTARTFIASASCIVARGARPVIADVDRDSQNLTAATVEAVLTPRTRAVIAVHLAGWPVDMDPLMDLARARGLKVIEDCAQAQGGAYRGRPIGTLGDMAAFSFCQDKILTTAGEGGMLVTDDEALWRRAWSYKDHGKDYDVVHRQDHPPGFRWLHESFGTNWRMTEVQAAVGRAALRKLPGWIEARRRNAAYLATRLASLRALRMPLAPPDVVHACYKLYAFVDERALAPGWDRDRIVAAIAAEGVPCLVGSCPEIYRERAFPPEWRPAAPLPVAAELGRTAIMFLVHPTLTPADLADTWHAIRKVFAVATAPLADRAAG